MISFDLDSVKHRKEITLFGQVRSTNRLSLSFDSLLFHKSQNHKLESNKLILNHDTEEKTRKNTINRVALLN